MMMHDWLTLCAAAAAAALSVVVYCGLALPGWVRPDRSSARVCCGLLPACLDAAHDKATSFPPLQATDIGRRVNILRKALDDSDDLKKRCRELIKHFQTIVNSVCAGFLGTFKFFLGTLFATPRLHASLSVTSHEDACRFFPALHVSHGAF